jgi:hypothetical protein
VIIYDKDPIHNISQVVAEAEPVFVVQVRKLRSQGTQKVKALNETVRKDIQRIENVAEHIVEEGILHEKFHLVTLPDHVSYLHEGVSYKENSIALHYKILLVYS